MMAAPPSVRVIVPTSNRKGPLRETLSSLAKQTYPSDRFEVIDLDDGSTDGKEAVAADTCPFTLRLVRQGNQGDAAARNFGMCSLLVLGLLLVSTALPFVASQRGLTVVFFSTAGGWPGVALSALTVFRFSHDRRGLP